MNTRILTPKEDQRPKPRIITVSLMTLLLLILSYMGLQSSLKERLTLHQGRDFHVIIREQPNGSSLPTFKARQGDQINIRIRSKVMGDANLHGYERKIRLRPGEEVLLSFTAGETGKYPLHLHQITEIDGSKREVIHRHLATFEIYPR